MNKLTTFWQIIQIIGSLRLVSPSLIRSLNPETYTFYCSYNPDNDGINKCGDLNCEYYQRLAGSVAGGVMGGGVTVFSGTSLFSISTAMADAAIPAVLSLSTVALTVGGVVIITAAVVGIVSVGARLTGKGMARTITGIENELKLQWEKEKLQKELTEIKEKLAEAIKKRDEYKEKWGESDSRYLQEKARAEELESQIKELKKRTKE